jgi:hypothetical protein
VSQNLRQQLNSKVDSLNSALAAEATTAGIQFKDNTDLQSRFDGHRFCENGGYPDVWIQDSLFENLNADEQQAILHGINQTVDSTNAVSNDTNSHLSGIFHPTKSGHTAYCEALKAHLNPAAGANGVTSTTVVSGVVSTSTSAATSTVAVRQWILRCNPWLHEGFELELD